MEKYKNEKHLLEEMRKSYLIGPPAAESAIRVTQERKTYQTIALANLQMSMHFWWRLKIAKGPCSIKF